MNQKKSNNSRALDGSARRRRVIRPVICLAAAMSTCVIPALAAEGSEPLQVINNLSDFVFQCIQAIGMILLGFGVVQIGLSLKGHDASQRAQGFMCFFGGLLIAFAKPILDSIL